MYAEYNVLEPREVDGGKEIVAAVLFELDCRVGSVFWVIFERRGEGGGIVPPLRTIDGKFLPSESKGHGGEGRD